jgi:hypothetical protein
MATHLHFLTATARRCARRELRRGSAAPAPRGRIADSPLRFIVPPITPPRAPDESRHASIRLRNQPAPFDLRGVSRGQ